VVLDGAVADRLLLAAVGRGDPRTNLRELTDREIQVFELLGRGRRTKEIAASLNISPKTVETHQQNLRTKLGARDGVELRRLATSWLVDREQSP
jgi:DNA-binding NarL/FixJ family response regulator